MDKILQYTDATGEVITVGFVGDLIIKDIDLSDTWTITTEDVDGNIYTSDHVGGRPNDRK